MVLFNKLSTIKQRHVDVEQRDNKSYYVYVNDRQINVNTSDVYLLYFLKFLLLEAVFWGF